MSFSLTIRVYAQDTDFGGVVHHTSYLRFMERARAEWAYRHGVALNQLATGGNYFVVRDAKVHYVRGATLGDELDIVSSLHKIGQARLVYEQEVRSHHDPDIVYAKALITIAFVNDAFKPVAIPDEIKKALTQAPDDSA